jgi:hypothetical protein
MTVVMPATFIGADMAWARHPANRGYVTKKFERRYLVHAICRRKTTADGSFKMPIGLRPKHLVLSRPMARFRQKVVDS